MEFIVDTSVSTSNTKKNQQEQTTVDAEKSAASMNSIFSKMSKNKNANKYLTDGTISLGEMLEYMNNNNTDDESTAISEDELKKATGFTKEDLEEINTAVANGKEAAENKVKSGEDTKALQKYWANIWNDTLKAIGFNKNDSAYFSQDNYGSAGGYANNETKTESSNVRIKLLEQISKSGTASEKGLAQLASTEELYNLANPKDNTEKDAVLKRLQERNDFVAKCYTEVNNSTLTASEKAAKINEIAAYVTNGIADGSLSVNQSMDSFKKVITDKYGLKVDDASSAGTETNAKVNNDKILQAASSLNKAFNEPDETTFLNTIASLNKDEIKALKKEYGEDNLKAKIKSFYADEDAANVMNAYLDNEGSGDKRFIGQDEDGKKTIAGNVAQELVSAIKNKDKKEINSIITTLTPEQMKLVKQKYEYASDQTLEKDLDGVYWDIDWSDTWNKGITVNYKCTENALGALINRK